MVVEVLAGRGPADMLLAEFTTRLGDTDRSETLLVDLR